MVCTTLKPHIADMIQREVCRQALHAAPLLCAEFNLVKARPAKLQVTTAMRTLLRKLAALEDVYIIVNDHTKDVTALEDKRKKAAATLTQAEAYLEEQDFNDTGTAMFGLVHHIPHLRETHLNYITSSRETRKNKTGEF